MKNLMKKFRAGKLTKVVLLSVALTGAMSVFNSPVGIAQSTLPNRCEFNGDYCPVATMGCVCD
jgi:hypothetical protein